MVYGVTPQTSSTEEGLKSYRETPPVLTPYDYRPQVTVTCFVNKHNTRHFCFCGASTKVYYKDR